MHYCCTLVRHRLLPQCLSPILLLRHLGKHQLISISSDDDFIASEDDSSNNSNGPSSNDNNSDSDSNNDSCAYDSDLENALARTPAAKPTTITKNHNTKAPLISSAITSTKTGSKAVLKASTSSSTGSSGAVFAKQRAALTTQYFTEFNEQVFSSALSDVAVTWNKRLNSTAGITKLSK
jgi:hypothetical protein